jgi:hypothetical protein
MVVSERKIEGYKADRMTVPSIRSSAPRADHSSHTLYPDQSNDMANQAPQLNEATFKDAVRTYIELHDEITKATKDMRDLKKQKDTISKQILGFMQRHKIDEFQVPDGKLMRKTSKRQESLKKEYIVSCLNSALGEEKAQAVLKTMHEQRNVTETDILLRTRQGKSTADE